MSDKSKSQQRRIRSKFTDNYDATFHSEDPDLLSQCCGAEQWGYTGLCTKCKAPAYFYTEDQEIWSA